MSCGKLTNAILDKWEVEEKELAESVVKKIHSSSDILNELRKRFGSEYNIIELDPEDSSDMKAIDRLGGMPDEEGKRRDPQQRLYTLKELEELKDFNFRQKMPFIESHSEEKLT